MSSTEKTIEHIIDHWLNPALGFPAGTRLWKRQDTRNVATIGMCYLYRCLGVWAIHRMCNEGGGVTVLLPDSTGKGLESQLRAFLAGLNFNA